MWQLHVSDNYGLLNSIIMFSLCTAYLRLNKILRGRQVVKLLVSQYGNPNDSDNLYSTRFSLVWFRGAVPQYYFIIVWMAFKEKPLKIFD